MRARRYRESESAKKRECQTARERENESARVRESESKQSKKTVSIERSMKIAGDFHSSRVEFRCFLRGPLYYQSFPSTS